MFRSLRKSLRSTLRSALLGVALTLGLTSSVTAASTLVISQVYGGGGNGGGVYTNDFIELHNLSSSPVNLSGYAVQYGSSGGTTWQTTTLSGTIQGGGYYLIQEAAGSTTIAALPTPDAIGTLALSGTNGKVALTSTTTALSGSNPTGGALVDLVGYGSANGYETSPVPALTNATAALRKDNGSTDTDNNSADFATGTPAPRNSASAIYFPGGVTPTPSGTPTPTPSPTPSPTPTVTPTPTLTPTPTPTPASSLTAGVSAGSGVDHLVNGQTVSFTVTVTPGTSPASTGLNVVGDLSPLGGAPNQTLALSGGNVFTVSYTVPASVTGGSKNLTFTVTDAQGRTAYAFLTLPLRGNLTIFHTNDTHARVTPHDWIIPQHSTNPETHFEAVGGAAYLGSKILSLTAAQPDALVLDGGDISEGNPIGDWNGPGYAVGSFGNATIVDYYKLLDSKLKALPGRGGRGLDAMVVGNHDIRNFTYLQNMMAAFQNNFPIISINICRKGTKTAYFAPYTIVEVNGNRVGVVGYTTESADSSDPAVTAAIDVVPCDWSSTDASKIHFADYVNELRNTKGCSMVILLTHMGHSGLCTVTSANPTPILVDTSAAKLPEIAVTGHWHTYAETVWQPTALNYKTIFTEAGSFMHYAGELRVDGNGKYLSNANYPIRVSEITPDADIAALVQSRKDAYMATNPTYGVDQVIGYTADDLLLDNYMKWWSSDEYPWSGDNSAGAWICDSMVWKSNQLWPSTPCDLALEAGGGVRSDIPKGPITYTQIYETFPWADDTLYLIQMTGQQIWTYIKTHGCDAALSRGWMVTAVDGVPTGITYNGAPIDLNRVYRVAINNYMYTHDTANLDQIDTAPLTSTYLARTALIEYTGTFTQSSPYQTGGPRYTLNTDFSGGYRAVVTMVSDSNSRTTFDAGFIRLLSANPETLAHRGTRQVPTSLVNADGSIVSSNRLSEIELYRSYLGLRTGLLHQGDILEVWGKGSFFEGDPEFVDQEGIKSDGVEFRVVGHDESLATPAFVNDADTGFDDAHKNHYVKMVVRKTGTNTVADRNGTAFTVWNVDAFTKKTLPGNTGDVLVLTGVPTSESYAIRFRCDSVILGSAAGVTALPAFSSVQSSLDPINPVSTTAVSLSAQATASAARNYSLTPVADAQVSSGNTGTNYGTSNNLFIQSATTTASSFGNERAWLRFDLSSLPAGVSVSSAKLNLFCWGAGTSSLPASVSVGVSDSWTETGLTWSNQPSFGAALDTVTLASGVTNQIYSWNVTAPVQTSLSGSKLVSLVVKPVTESSSSALTYKFDSKEFGSNAPTLSIATVPSTGASLARVDFYYRFSADHATWGGWTLAGSDTSAPYAFPFSFPEGYGYYEFYSLATDSNGVSEPAPAAAQTATHYLAAPPYTTAAIVTLNNLAQTYDGTAKTPLVATIPGNLMYSVTYDGASQAPSHAGSYAVQVTVNAPGYTGSASGTLVVGKASQVVQFPSPGMLVAGGPPVTLGATSDAGLPVSYTTGNSQIVALSGGKAIPGIIGSTVLTATQAGDADHFAATPVSVTVQVAATSTTDDVPLLPGWAFAGLAGGLVALGLRFTRRYSKFTS